MTQGRIVEITEQGEPEVMQMKSFNFSDPEEGEVLINQKALGMNFLDVYHRSGAYPLSMPSGIGTEAAGVIAKVGAGVKVFKEGDRVAYGGGAPGGYADCHQGGTYRGTDGEICGGTDNWGATDVEVWYCLLYTSPSPRDRG